MMLLRALQKARESGNSHMAYILAKKVDDVDAESERKWTLIVYKATYSYSQVLFFFEKVLQRARDIIDGNTFTMQ